MQLLYGFALMASPFVFIALLSELERRLRGNAPIVEPPRSTTPIEPGDVAGAFLGIPVVLAGLLWALIGIAVFLSPLVLLLWLVAR